MPTIEPDGEATTRGRLTQALLVVAAFCGLSLLGRSVPAAFSAAVLMGLALPLIWGRRTGSWQTMGFTTQNVRSAVAWGTGAGAITSLIGILTVGKCPPVAKLGLQLAIGIPLWLLLISPFQEFFFRGWLQPRFESALGRWGGLVGANLCFTLWHYASPLVDGSTFPLATVQGALATFGAGLVYGYAFQRTRNIIAPWLAHALSGLAFVLIGATVFVQPGS